MNCDCELHIRGGYETCEDCEEEYPMGELQHYRYEPEMLLCSSCYAERDKEDED